MSPFVQLSDSTAMLSFVAEFYEEQMAGNSSLSPLSRRLDKHDRLAGTVDVRLECIKNLHGLPSSLLNEGKDHNPCVAFSPWTKSYDRKGEKRDVPPPPFPLRITGHD